MAEGAEMTVRILIGDVRERLAELPDDSVHCVVTSPPYFGLRDYGMAGQIGLEATPAAFVETMVAVFRDVRRVLRADGTCWINLGDSYNSHDPGGYREGEFLNPGGRQSEAARGARNKAGNHVAGLKRKDLIGIPWRVAFALQQPYYTGKIRDERDRIWLAAMIDGEGCFFIHKRKAGSSAHSTFTKADGTESNYARTADTFGVGLEICNTSKAIIDRVAEIVGGGTFTSQGSEQNARRKQTIYRWRVAPNEAKRIASEVYPHLVSKQHQARLLINCPSSGNAGAAAHQAMMDLHNGVPTSVDYPAPATLFEPGWYLRQDCIWAKSNPMPESVTDRCTKAHEYLFLLSKSARYYFDAAAIAEPAAYPGDDRHMRTDVRKAVDPMCMDGGSRARTGNPTGETRNRRSVWTVATQPFSEAHFATFPPALIEPCIIAGCPKGGTVLDPFGGAGTTGLVADRHGRHAILIELNPEYAAMAERRIKGDSPLFAEVA